MLIYRQAVHLKTYNHIFEMGFYEIYNPIVFHGIYIFYAAPAAWKHQPELHTALLVRSGGGKPAECDI